MNMPRKPTNFDISMAASAGLSQSDFRARAAEIAAESKLQRQRDLEEQSSKLRSASERIQLWEKLHGARLPSKRNHPVLAVVAADTGLTLAQVGAEQRQRTEGKPAADTSIPG
jgi:hypothetical protein